MKVNCQIKIKSRESIVNIEEGKGMQQKQWRSYLHIQACDTHTSTILHDEIEGEELDHVRGVEGQGSAVQGVKHGVSGTVSSGRTTIGLTALA